MMGARLGETGDPTQLVPGRAAAVADAVTSLARYRDVLHQAGSGLSRINDGGWTGEAADAFRARFHGQPEAWVTAGDCFGRAAAALDDYARILTWAQGQAAQAIVTWNHGTEITDQAWAQHQQAVQQTGQAMPFVDPGAAQRASADSALQDARRQLQAAGDTAERTIATARDLAPEKPGFWSGAGDLAGDFVDGAANLGGHLINGVASVGNAMVNHPGDLAVTAAGIGLMVLGAGGEVGGVALDVTVVGAAPGVALNVGSAAVIATGGTMAAAGMGSIIMHSVTDDSIDPVNTDRGASDEAEFESTEGFRNSEFSRDEIEQFINGHTGDSLPGSRRPTPQEVGQVLDEATPVRMPGQNAEEFVATVNGEKIRVIVNYDVPWRSTSYRIGEQR